MLADIPSLFGPGMVIEEPMDWVAAPGTKFYMQWYGLPARIIGGKVHRWDNGWVECSEKTDVEYIDAYNCSCVVPLFAKENVLEDGRYFLVGLSRDNAYGFRHPMLVPFDFYGVQYERSLSPDDFREFLMFQPNMFGVMLNNGDKWCNVCCTDLEIKFRYDDGASVPSVQEGDGKEIDGKSSYVCTASILLDTL